jgi:gas vesicle protein
MNSKSLLYGIATGVVLASTATLLTTPASGRDLQQSYKAKIKKWRRDVNQFSHDTIILKEKVTETTQLGIQSIKEVSGEVKEVISDWKKDVQPSLNQLKKDTDALQQRVKEMKQLS